MASILFLHGLNGSPDGTKARLLREAGFEVIAPVLSKDDFDGDVRAAQQAFDKHRPEVVLGSSRGGAVALNIDCGRAPLVLVAPAWKHWGAANSTKSETVVLHSAADEIIPLADSRELLENSRLDESHLIVVGESHPLNDEAALTTLRRTVEHLAVGDSGQTRGATTAAQSSRSPLGLPRGSVRAVLTLVIVAVVVIELVRGHQIPMLWTETLMIALAHYFTSRRFIQLPQQVLRRLESEGYLDFERNPLYLPRHTIRAIVVLSFAGLAVYLYRQNRLFEQDSLAILGTVLAYLVGVLLRPVLDSWSKNATKTVQWWEDIKAFVVLLALGVTATVFLIDRPEILPQLARNTTLALVLFYFGSR